MAVTGRRTRSIGTSRTSARFLTREGFAPTTEKSLGRDRYVEVPRCQQATKAGSQCRAAAPYRFASYRFCGRHWDALRALAGKGS